MLKGAELTVLLCVALGCITILEAVALWKGVDGVVFASVITIFGVFIGSAGTAIFVRKK